MHGPPRWTACSPEILLTREGAPGSCTSPPSVPHYRRARARSLAANSRRHHRNRRVLPERHRGLPGVHKGTFTPDGPEWPPHRLVMCVHAPEHPSDLHLLSLHRFHHSRPDTSPYATSTCARPLWRLPTGQRRSAGSGLLSYARHRTCALNPSCLPLLHPTSSRASHTRKRSEGVRRACGWCPALFLTHSRVA
jgi:hypothetical protein